LFVACIEPLARAMSLSAPLHQQATGQRADGRADTGSAVVERLPGDGVHAEMFQP
jgi:hypothetical protein